MYNYLFFIYFYQREKKRYYHGLLLQEELDEMEEDSDEYEDAATALNERQDDDEEGAAPPMLWSRLKAKGEFVARGPTVRKANVPRAAVYDEPKPQLSNLFFILVKKQFACKIGSRACLFP